jgi:TldD protein
MTRLLPLIQTLIFLGCTVPAIAESDPVLNALVDETDRSTKALHLDSHLLPYFVAYRVKEVDQLSCFSCLGSVPEMQRDCQRIVKPIVRIGSYDLDSSYLSTSRPKYFAPLTVDNDYSAVRRTAWLATDAAYKLAITQFEWKKAYLSDYNVQDRLPDMTREAPTVSTAMTEKASIDKEKWCNVVQQLSAIFRGYPALQKSKVTFLARDVITWYVSSEGAKIRDSRRIFALTIWATAQASDGMPVSDHDAVASPDEKSLPDYEQLKALTENLAKRVTGLRLAPKADEYCGPVLFEGQGAAEFFSQIMAPNFGLAEEFLASHEDWRNPLTKLVGRRILPTFISVVDDPQATEYKGVSLVGGYRFDDDGMPGEKIRLVENGVLKGFCQSRVPTRLCQKSNGHSQGGLGVHSILKVSSSKTTSPDDLRSRMRELATDAGLDYILVIPRLCVCNSYGFVEDTFGYPIGTGVRTYDTPSYSAQPTDPIGAYRLYLADGHKELVRGLEFRDVSLRAFRDIDAVLDDSSAYLVEPHDRATRHLITPSYLVRELELTPVKAEHSAPPKLPGPLTIESVHSEADADPH